MRVLQNLTQILLKQSYKSNHAYLQRICSLSSYTPSYYDGERDPAPVFFNNDIQSLLKLLTRVDLNKVYKKRKLGDNRPELPVYKFMTEEQLQETFEEAKRRAENILHMPPVVQLRNSIDRIYANDIPLQGLEATNIVFTDITFGLKDRDRLIVVREPNGTLRDANWDERDRMTQVYFPKSHRKLKNPKMFYDDYFESLLKREEYEFILNRACVQFEPDHPDYQRVASITYQYVNDNSSFESLRSTRHFGPLAFYLSWFKNIDNLLLELIETAQIEEANHLLHLHKKIHDLQFNVTDMHGLGLDGLSWYIQEVAQKKASLELALKAYKDLVKQRNQLQQNINVAHGVV